MPPGTLLSTQGARHHEYTHRPCRRARAEHLEVTFQVADAEELPFADESFDAVLSTFGVMFMPDHAKAAA